MIEGASKNMPFNVQAYNNITRIQEAKRKEQVNALERPVSYTNLRAHETREDLVWRLLV